MAIMVDTRTTIAGHTDTATPDITADTATGTGVTTVRGIAGIIVGTIAVTTAIITGRHISTTRRRPIGGNTNPAAGSSLGTSSFFIP